MEFGDENFMWLLAELDRPSSCGQNSPKNTTALLSYTSSSQPIAMAARNVPPQATDSNSPGSLATQHSDVDASDPEYMKIKRDLENAGLKMVRLVKLSNPVLSEKFDNESAHLMKIKQKMDGFALNIKNLYHGTTAPFDQICDEGLDERLSRRGLFGRGIYFSDNPKKCCKYSEHKTSKSKPYMLRCKVILGDIKVYPPNERDSTLTKEPVKMVKDGKRVYYDSIKGQPKDYTEYIIYEKRRALIEYIAFYDPPPPPVNVVAKPSKTAPLVMAISHVPSSSSMSSLTASESSDTDSALFLRRPCSRSSTPDSGAGSGHNGSLGSSRGTPVGSGEEDNGFDGGDGGGDPAVDASMPVYSDTYVVPQVTAIRQRTKPVTAAASNPSQIITTAGSSIPAPNVTAASAATGGATGVSRGPVAAAVSNEIYHSPHLAALRYLLDMKGKIPQPQLDLLTREYHRTYGAQGSFADGGVGSALKPLVDDPVSQVMTKLIQEFQDITRCTDTTVCQRYIELGNMDLNAAVTAYIDSLS